MWLVGWLTEGLDFQAGKVSDLMNEWMDCKMFCKLAGCLGKWLPDEWRDSLVTKSFLEGTFINGLYYGLLAALVTAERFIG